MSKGPKSNEPPPPPGSNSPAPTGGVQPDGSHGGNTGGGNDSGDSPVADAPALPLKPKDQPKPKPEDRTGTKLLCEGPAPDPSVPVERGQPPPHLANMPVVLRKLLDLVKASRDKATEAQAALSEEIKGTTDATTLRAALVCVTYFNNENPTVKLPGRLKDEVANTVGLELMLQKAPLDAVDEEGMPVFLRAIENGNLELVRSMLDAGGATLRTKLLKDLKTKDTEENALMVAIRAASDATVKGSGDQVQKKLEIVKLLLQTGRNVPDFLFLTEKSGQTALDIALVEWTRTRPKATPEQLRRQIVDLIMEELKVVKRTKPAEVAALLNTKRGEQPVFARIGAKRDKDLAVKFAELGGDLEPFSHVEGMDINTPNFALRRELGGFVDEVKATRSTTDNRTALSQMPDKLAAIKTRVGRHKKRAEGADETPAGTEDSLTEAQKLPPAALKTLDDEIARLQREKVRPAETAVQEFLDANPGIEEICKFDPFLEGKPEKGPKPEDQQNPKCKTLRDLKAAVTAANREVTAVQEKKSAPARNIPAYAPATLTVTAVTEADNVVKAAQDGIAVVEEVVSTATQRASAQDAKSKDIADYAYVAESARKASELAARAAHLARIVANELVTATQTIEDIDDRTARIEALRTILRKLKGIQALSKREDGSFLKALDARDKRAAADTALAVIREAFDQAVALIGDAPKTPLDIREVTSLPAEL